MHGFFRKQGCEDIREQLSAYIDGQTTSSKGASIEKHLTSCEPCREELTSLRATKSVLSLMPSVAIPRSFHIVSYRPVRRPAAFGILRLATAAMAFLLALVWAGDYWNVYPKAPVVTAPPVAATVPAPVATPSLTPDPTPAPVLQGPSPEGRGLPLGVVPVTVVPGTPAPAPAPGTPVVDNGPAAAPAQATPLTTGPLAPEGAAAGPEYAWPVRQVEYVLLVVVAVLAISWIIASQCVYARNKRD